MTATSHDRDLSAVQRRLANVYEDLCRRNVRRSGRARVRAMRARIDRALQAALPRPMRDRG